MKLDTAEQMMAVMKSVPAFAELRSNGRGKQISNYNSMLPGCGRVGAIFILETGCETVLCRSEV